MQIQDNEKVLTAEMKAKFKLIEQEYRYLTKDLEVRIYKRKSARMGFFKPRVNGGIINVNVLDREEISIVATFAHEFAHFLQHKGVRRDFKGRFSERDAQFYEVSKINNIYGVAWKLIPVYQTYNYGDGRVIKKRFPYDEIKRND